MTKRRATVRNDFQCILPSSSPMYLYRTVSLLFYVCYWELIPTTKLLWVFMANFAFISDLGNFPSFLKMNGLRQSLEILRLTQAWWLTSLWRNYSPLFIQLSTQQLSSLPINNKKSGYLMSPSRHPAFRMKHRVPHLGLWVKEIRPEYPSGGRQEESGFISQDMLIVSMLSPVTEPVHLQWGNSPELLIFQALSGSKGHLADAE